MRPGFTWSEGEENLRTLADVVQARTAPVERREEVKVQLKAAAEGRGTPADRIAEVSGDPTPAGKLRAAVLSQVAAAAKVSAARAREAMDLLPYDFTGTSRARAARTEAYRQVGERMKTRSLKEIPSPLTQEHYAKGPYPKATSDALDWVAGRLGEVFEPLAPGISEIARTGIRAAGAVLKPLGGTASYLGERLGKPFNVDVFEPLIVRPADMMYGASLDLLAGRNVGEVLNDVFGPAKMSPLERIYDRSIARGMRNVWGRYRAGEATQEDIYQARLDKTAKWIAQMTVETALGRKTKEILGERVTGLIGMSVGSAFTTALQFIADPFTVAAVFSPARTASALRGADALGGTVMRYAAKNAKIRGFFANTRLGNWLTSIWDTEAALKTFSLIADDVRVAKASQAMYAEVKGRIITPRGYQSMITSDFSTFVKGLGDLVRVQPTQEAKTNVVMAFLRSIRKTIAEDQQIAMRARRQEAQVAQRVVATVDNIPGIKALAQDEIDNIARVAIEVADGASPVAADLMAYHQARARRVALERLRRIASWHEGRVVETGLEEGPKLTRTEFPYSTKEIDDALVAARRGERAAKAEVRRQPWKDLELGEYDAAGPMLWTPDSDPYVPGLIPQQLSKLATTGFPSRMFRRYLSVARSQMFGAMSLRLDLMKHDLKPIIDLARNKPWRNMLRIFGEDLSVDRLKEGLARFLLGGGVPPPVVEPGSAKSKVNYIVRWADDAGKLLSKKFEDLQEAARFQRTALADKGISSALHHGPGLLARPDVADVIGSAVGARRMLNAIGGALVQEGLLSPQAYIRRHNRYIPRLFQAFTGDSGKLYDEMFDPNGAAYQAFREVAGKKVEEIAKGLVEAEPRNMLSQGAERRLAERHDAFVLKFPYEYRGEAGRLKQGEFWLAYTPPSPKGAFVDVGEGKKQLAVIERMRKAWTEPRVRADGTRILSPMERKVADLAKKAAKRGGFEPAYSMGHPRVAAQPLSAEWLHLFRELKEPIPASVKGLVDANRIIHQKRFHDHIARIPGIAFDDADQAIARWGLPNAVRLPTGIKALGALRGKVVNAWTFETLMDSFRVPTLFERLIRSPWAAGKTILSPITWTRNFISNFVYAHYMGVPVWNPSNWRYYIGAMRHAARNSALFKEMKLFGMGEGLWTAEDVRSFSRAFLERWESRKPDFIAGFQDTFQHLRRGYGAIDWLFKAAAYLKQVSRYGAGPEDAMAWVRAFSPNYDMIPRIFESLPTAGRMNWKNAFRIFTARRSPVGPWFVPFSVENMRCQINAIRYQPLKFAFWVGMRPMLTSESIMRSGRDPTAFLATSGALGMADPNGINQGGFPFALTHAIVDVGPGKYGRREVTMPLEEWFPVWGGLRPSRTKTLLNLVLGRTPAANFADAMAGQFFGGPGMEIPTNLITLLSGGYDLRTGTQVVPKDATYLDTAKIMLDRTFEALLPPVIPEVPELGIRGGTTFRKMRDLIEGDVADRSNAHQSLAIRSLRMLGLNAREIDDRHRASWIVSMLSNDGVRVVPLKEYTETVAAFREGSRKLDVTKLTDEEFLRLDGVQSQLQYKRNQFMREYGFDTWEGLRERMRHNPLIAREYVSSAKEWITDAFIQAKFGSVVKTFQNMGTDKQAASILLMERIGIDENAMAPYRQLFMRKLAGLRLTPQKQDALRLRVQGELQKAGFRKEQERGRSIMKGGRTWEEAYARLSQTIGNAFRAPSAWPTK